MYGLNMGFRHPRIYLSALRAVTKHNGSGDSIAGIVAAHLKIFPAGARLCDAAAQRGAKAELWRV
jgi:hypothetical protein